MAIRLHLKGSLEAANLKLTNPGGNEARKKVTPLKRFQKRFNSSVIFARKRESICDSVSNNKLNFSKETNLT